MSTATAFGPAGNAVPALTPPAAPRTGQPRRYINHVLKIAFAAIGTLQLATVGLAVSHLQGSWATMVAAVGIVGVLVTVCTGVWVVRRVITKTLEPALAAVGRLSVYDLRSSGAVVAGHDKSPLLHGLKQVREHLLAVVSQVRTGTVNVALNAGQVKRDNERLEQRTQAQAESLQETAASLEQLTAAVRQTASIAQETNALVRATADRAGQGGDAMREVVETMGSIRASSNSIRDIIGVIDSIAFQTNILALNAAVEAARAGDQGRGFAVVATEVRSLAKRCADAAREVKALIGASVDKVDRGGARVEEAGRAMNEIVSSVRQVAELIGQMDIASREQSSGIDTINLAIARIDSSTQANAELVQQGVRTVTGLQERCAALWNAVNVFGVGDEEHATAQEAIELVGRGCEYLRTNGRQALLDEVNQLDFGSFIHRDIYLMVLRVDDGTFVAHGNNPGRVGTGPEVTDARGKHFARELARMARERGEGWVDYHWLHPITGEISVKSGYVRRDGDIAVCCSINKR